MAVSTPALLSQAVSDSDAASRNTAFITPTVGGCLVGAFYGRETTGGAPAPNLAITASAGTWSLAEATVSDSKTNRHTLSAVTGETPNDYGASVRFTATPDENCNRWGWLLMEVLGTTATVVQSKTGTSASASPSLTLDSPPDADNIVIGICASVGLGAGITPGSGFTEIGDTGSSNLTALQAQWRTGSTSTTVAFADCGTTSNLLIALEIEAAAGSTSRKIIFRVNNTSETSIPVEVDLGVIPPGGLMIAGAATYDPAGDVELSLSTGSGAAAPVTGTAKTQSGDLVLLNSLSSGTVITQTVAARLGDVITYDAPFTTIQRRELLLELAERVKPVVSDLAVEISGLTETSISLAGVVQDPSLSDWYIVSATAQDGGHIVSPIGTNAKSFTVSPVGQAGTTQALVTVSNNFGLAGLYPRTASLTVTMTKVADSTTTAVWPWLTYPLPTGLPTVSVSTRAALDSEIGSASSATGKVIRVSGNLTGSALTITKTMARDKPLIIEAVNQGGATFNFHTALNGQFCVLRNITVPVDGISIRGKCNSALHCKITWNGGWVHGRAVYFTNGALFGYAFGCEVRSAPYPSGTRPADNIRRNAIFWDGNGWAGQPKWCMASYCHVTEGSARPVPTQYSSGSTAAIILGDDISISQVPTDNIVYRTLLRNAKGGHGQIETKMSRVWFIESGIADSPSVNNGGAANINNRQGNGSEYLRCFVHRSGGFEIHRAANRLVCPSVRNGSSILITAGAGDYYNYGQVGQNSTFCPADETRVIRPVGRVVVGENYAAGSASTAARPIPVRATKIEAASNVVIDYAIDTNQGYVSGDPSAAAVELLPSQVGLDAPEADDFSGLPIEMQRYSGWEDWTVNWQHYKTTGNSSSVVQTDTGFEVKAGPNTTTAGNIYVFSRYAVSYSNLQLDFDFTRTDGGGGTAAGEAFLVYFSALGKGTALTPVDLSTLDYAAFRTIEDEMSGYRLSFGQSSGFSNDNQMRLRIFRADGTAGEQIISTSPSTFVFPQGVPHRIHVMKRADWIRIVVTRLDNRAVMRVETTDSRLAELTGGGHIGIRHMPGRSGRIESIKVTRF